ncbi:MAG: histidine kinase dimerization/phospho-acceptor domain-containing protein, partial [Clostridium sp.]
MKDKILYKSQKQNIISMMLSLILTGVTLAVGKVAILPIYYNLYYGKLGAFGQSIGKIIYNIRHGILSREILLIIIFTTIFFIWFIILTRKRERHLNNTMKLVKGMANGNEFSTLNESFKGQYGDFSRNINCIIKRLQKSLEEQMIIEKTKSDLITNVSHDLRTPLTSVIGYLSIIDEDKCRDEVEIRQYVNIAYEKAKGLNILINDLFELTRMRTPSVGIKYSEINMCELLGQ